ncbi:hypothetical protein [Sphingobium xenophagum]|uniref:hypothetical protein n=1 Tax=Sphingobium xenophagum TaxID=121428 RepID=UPI0013EEA05F|nr:hypothetical protein [Sphingobium xenophagum]
MGKDVAQLAFSQKLDLQFGDDRGIFAAQSAAGLVDLLRDFLLSRFKVSEAFAFGHSGHGIFLSDGLPTTCFLSMECIMIAMEMLQRGCLCLLGDVPRARTETPAGSPAPSGTRQRSGKRAAKEGRTAQGRFVMHRTHGCCEREPP